MRYPEKNSRGEKILGAFYDHGPMTIWQGEEKHGSFPTLRVPGGIDHNKLTELYCDLVERSCLARDGILYKLTLRASQHIERLRQPAVPLQIVPARVRNFLAKRIFFGNSPFAPNCVSL